MRLVELERLLPRERDEGGGDRVLGAELREYGANGRLLQVSRWDTMRITDGGRVAVAIDGPIFRN